MYELLATILVEDIGVEPGQVSREATLAELELDSLSLAELAVIVTERTGVPAEDAALRADMDLGAVADAFERAAAVRPTSAMR